MNRLPSSFDGLQITLLALLPKDGTPMTVHQLAKATGAKEFERRRVFRAAQGQRFTN